MLYRKYHQSLFFRFAAACAVFLCSTAARAQDAAKTTDGDWAYYGRDYTNQRYSPLTEINADNVNNLKLTWSYHTGKTGSFQASPIVLDGIMYITTPFNDVIALSADTGKEIWHYKHQLRSEHFCCGPANRGPAVAYGKVYMATIDARLIALDQKTGKVIWDIPITDPDTSEGETLEPLLGVKELHGAVQTGQTGYTANLAPQVYNGMVFVGITGAGYGLHLEFEEDGKQILSVGGLSGGGHGLRGFLVAYDAETGKEIWRWYSVPDSGWEGKWRETAADISLNREITAEKLSFKLYKDTWRYGGGSIWSTPAIDPEIGRAHV